ncbi:hypothetical protein MMC12_006352 [Toensbergia leucococca]|nr:hypothetical protein [Toensbergia leucococca]
MTGSNNFLVPGRLGEDQNLILTVFSIKDDSNDSVNDSNPFDDAFEVFDSDDDSEFSNSNDSYEFADPDENSEFSKKDLHLINDYSEFADSNDSYEFVDPHRTSDTASCLGDNFVFSEFGTIFRDLGATGKPSRKYLDDYSEFSNWNRFTTLQLDEEA